MPAGRPTEYDPDLHPHKAEEYARSGLTNTEIADRLGISRKTFHNWQNEHPEFLHSIKRGKETPDDNVEASLYKRAIGYSFVETKETKDAEGNITKTETVIKQIPPDTGAACMWLKNRRPKEWRDTHEITGKDGDPIQFVTAMTDEEVISNAKRIISSRSGNTE